MKPIDIYEHEHLYNDYDMDGNIICYYCGKNYNDEIKERINDI